MTSEYVERKTGGTDVGASGERLRPQQQQQHQAQQLRQHQRERERDVAVGSALQRLVPEASVASSADVLQHVSDETVATPLARTASDVKRRVAISFDVEATGPAPTTNSCVMLGFVAVFEDVTEPNPYDTTGWLVDRCQWCLQEYRPADSKCWNDFWSNNLNVWEHIQANALSPYQVMREFHDWFDALNQAYTVRFVAKPAAYDWQWLNCLYAEFGPADKLDLGFKATCLSTMLHVCELAGADRNTLHREISFTGFKHTHMADEDALQQGYQFLKLNGWIQKHLKCA
jgi:hypothetical protein